MSGFLSALLSLSVLVFAASSMLSAGLGHRLSEVVGPLRHPGDVLRVLLANFVLVPLLAFIVLRLLDPPTPLAIGLFLTATAAGAPFLVKLAVMADADLGLSTTLLLLLLPVTIVYMPIVVPFAVPEAEVSAVAIARPLVLTMLLPLALGLMVRAQREPLAVALQPLFGKLSSISLVALIAATIVANLSGILAVFRTSAILAVVIVIAGAFGIGFLLGGPSMRRREVLGLGTAQRNISAATVVATQVLDDPPVVTMVVVTSLVGFAVLFPLAALLRRYSALPAGATAPRRE